jgi:sarcosine oxidase subunit beta
VYQPPLILQAFAEEASAEGAQFRYGATADERGIEASRAVVVAAGIWSREVGETLGVALEVTPLERGVFQVGPFDWLQDTIPMTLDAGSGYHFRERDGRLLVIGPGDQHEWDHYREWLTRRAPAAALAQPELHWASCGFSGHGVMHSPAIADSLSAMILGETPPVDISALDPLRTEGLTDVTQL